jgi:hypothetical protein
LNSITNYSKQLFHTTVVELFASQPEKTKFLSIIHGAPRFSTLYNAAVPAYNTSDLLRRAFDRGDVRLPETRTY